MCNLIIIFSSISHFYYAMNMQVSTKPELIEKEKISSLHFDKSTAVKQHPELKAQIENATRLGNAYHSKVSIIFNDNDGLKRVETTIWAGGDRYICLKGGVWLPIDHIVEIKM